MVSSRTVRVRCSVQRRIVRRPTELCAGSEPDAKILQKRPNEGNDTGVIVIILSESMRKRRTTEQPTEQPRLHAPAPPLPEYREPETKPEPEPRGATVVDFYL